ncbi:MAG: PDGLE domain-containing protein [Mycobacterium sp.]
MTEQRTSARRSFWILFAVATLVIAGMVSYFASSSPDGLDSATLQGCDVVETAAGEQLTGSCIAQSATDHHLSASPLADYAIAGRAWSGGLAGILGVVVTLVAAGGVFSIIARSRGSSPAES